MKLATSLNLLNERTNAYNYFKGGHCLKAMELCKDAGFEVLDWNSGDYASPKTELNGSDLVCDNWQSNIEAMRNKADQLGMRFNQCHGLMYNYFNQDEKTEFLHKMEERVMVACKILGIPRIVYHPVVPDGLREIQDAAGCKAANLEYISKAAEKAAKLGIEIAVENMFNTHKTDGTMFWRYCSTPEELNDLVDSINMENVCVCLDVGHAHIMGEDFEKTIACYGKRLKALHIADNDRSSDQHLLPYHGTINWDSVMKALSENEYPGEFTYEIHNATIRMPVELRQLMLRESYEVGQWLLKKYDSFSKV